MGNHLTQKGKYTKHNTKYSPSHGTYQTKKVSCCGKSYNSKLLDVRFSTTETYIFSLILQITFKGEMSEEAVAALKIEFK